MSSHPVHGDSPSASLALGLSLVIGPAVALASLATFLFGLHLQGLVEARPILIAVAVGNLVLNGASLRWPRARPFARFSATLTLAFAVYATAALTGGATGVSLLDRPSGLLALVCASWTCAAAFSLPLQRAANAT